MKDNFTSIAVVIDASGSMTSTRADTIGSFNTFIKDQKAIPGEAILTLATFDHNYKLIHDGVNLQDVPELTEKDYIPGGMTALFDAIGRTIDAVGRKLSSMKEEERCSKSLVLVITDGEENSSKEYKLERIKEMVSHQQDKYSWQFIFIGANINSFASGTSIGVKAGSTYSYNSTSTGTARLYDSMSFGTSNFRRAKVGAAFTMVDPQQADQQQQGQQQSTTVIDATPPTITTDGK